MGMFDRIHCTYDLGPGFYNKTLQTKDIECMMAVFWLDPGGHLYEIDYSGTSDFVEDPDQFLGFGHKKNGNHGKIRPFYFTGDVEVYPENWDCKYAAYPRQKITFLWGELCTKN
jgi:hypothetical protein